MLRTILVSSLIFWVGLEAAGVSTSDVVSIKCGENKLSPKKSLIQFYSFNSEISTGEIIFTGNATVIVFDVTLYRGLGSPSDIYRNSSLWLEFLTQQAALWDMRDAWHLTHNINTSPLLVNKINTVKIKIFADHYDIIINGIFFYRYQREYDSGVKIKAAAIRYNFETNNIYLNCTNVSTYGEITK
ncbi:unnamed protein product [Caenorhabditis angaria]|uniref:Galectin n=1 Tax=Caenorhabditis angaria TaxID=860376 RepID=A0A9P1ILB0_9PELO|nr:unnamed protein product [Caenorhabditis angaria]